MTITYKPSEPITGSTTEPDVIGKAHAVNSVDATTGQPMFARVTARKLELETVLATLDPQDSHTRKDIEAALATLEPMLSVDPTAVPAMVVVDMNRWLERTKHLGERATPAS
jgi:hypothetical protein